METKTSVWIGIQSHGPEAEVVHGSSVLLQARECESGKEGEGKILSYCWARMGVEVSTVGERIFRLYERQTIHRSPQGLPRFRGRQQGVW